MKYVDIFSLFLVVIFFRLHDATINHVVDLSVKEIADGIKMYCIGKTNDFCSQKQLYYFKKILKEKADKKRHEIERKQYEQKLREKEQLKKQEKIRYDMEMRKIKAWREFTELFSMRNF